MGMNDSILDSTKKALQLQADYDVFDPDIIMHINSAFNTLSQLGIGPVEGFMIEDDSATWGEFLDNNLKYNQVRTYVFLRVKLIFDPPATSFVLTSMQEQIREMEWRMNVDREGDLATTIISDVVIEP